MKDSPNGLAFLRKSHAGCDSPPDCRQEPPFESISKMKDGVVILNFARDGLVNLDAVKEALEAYESLSTAQKDEFDIALSGKLMNLCYDLSLLIVSDLVKAVNELPVVEELTPEYVDEIMELWSDYEFLDDTVIEELDDDIIKKLEAAHEYALDIKENGATYVSVTDVFSNWQWIVLGVCAFLLFTALVFNVVIFVIALKKNKTKKKETTKMAANAE